ncbi:N-formylglutamate amidohydrolase [Roseomonas sp. HJA6]|uniref:N-formylglutamate amidohydrolase n=1 Tax=Roseomonas alba TaxID=2846776 RepID=A0ABS7A7B7_9PROT|nr:N-formylglutamate amidohydrolase [Neoroseomonas alba]MBW6398197.1 N-formylglutamate amidohydrolase [Neoroseomonas alba]
MLMDVMPGVFSRRDPAGEPAPVLFEIPRSGAEYPRDFRSIASLTDLQRSISMYVEECYAGVVGAGATWLYAHCPNACIDLNRHELDIEPSQLAGEWPEMLRPGPKTKSGIGLIPTICAGTKPLYDAPLPVAEVRKRLDHYYWPYHNEVTRLLQGFRAKHGVAYHLSCHSMPAMPAANAPDAGQRRSDFDLGDRNGSTCGAELVEVVAGVLKGFGYRVTSNTHFVGAESVRKHGAPDLGIHSLQIEMNRSLYMDEEARTRRPELATIRTHLAAVAARVVDLAQARR